MDCSTPGLPVHHQFLESTQTHVRWVGDAIQPSHPLLSPSPPAFNLSQHQCPFKWVSSLHQVAKVLEFSASASVLPMNIQDWFPLGWTGWISLLSKGFSRVFSNHIPVDMATKTNASCHVQMFIMCMLVCVCTCVDRQVDYIHICVYLVHIFYLLYLLYINMANLSYFTWETSLKQRN